MKGHRTYIGCSSAKNAQAKIISYLYNGKNIIDTEYYGDRDLAWKKYKEAQLLPTSSVGFEYQEKEGKEWVMYDVAF